jgi:DNA-binding beta-propeller fold protein YncE
MRVGFGMRAFRSGLAASLVAGITFFGAGLVVPPAAAQTFIRSFGAGILNNPRDVTIDLADGSKVYVADRLNAVVDVFSSGGVALTTIGNSMLGTPVGVAIDTARDNLIVTDQLDRQVVVFSATASSSTPPILGITGADIGSPCGQFRFQQPFGVAVDPGTDDIVVADATADRVLVFSNMGICIASFGGPGTAPGQFEGPAGVAIDPTNGDILVAEQTNKRVQVFAGIRAPGGIAFKQTLGAGILLQPARVVVDAEHGGNILVSDQMLDEILVFSPAGALLGTIGGTGRFGSPGGMAFDTVNGNNLVVVDVAKNQIDVFGDSFAPVPALGGWALLLSALLLGGIGWRAVDRSGTPKRLG